MIKRYQQKRKETNRDSRIAGVVLALSVNGLIILTGIFSGFRYVYPPPEEKAIVLDFTELEEENPDILKHGRQPVAEAIDKTKPIELVKESEAQHIGTKPNQAEEATIGPEGDVEVPEPERPKEINKKALFSSANNKAQKDTLAAQTAHKFTDKLSEGHPEGNTKKGISDGEPNARLKGRHTVGTLISPSYSVQKAGTVVVDIWVDNTGTVTKAIAGADGTTVTDKTLWTAARNAAMKAHFNPSGEPIQQGTITYIFKLR